MLNLVDRLWKLNRIYYFSWKECTLHFYDATFSFNMFSRDFVPLNKKLFFPVNLTSAFLPCTGSGNQFSKHNFLNFRESLQILGLQPEFQKFFLTSRTIFSPSTQWLKWLQISQFLALGVSSQSWKTNKLSN